MSQVVEHLAQLTAFRDRDAVHTTLASALRSLLPLRQVSIHRSIGDEHDPRWFTLVRLGVDDVVAGADPLWTDCQDLPPLRAHPERLQALRLQRPVARHAPPHRMVFPLTADQSPAGVLEIDTDRPLDAEAHHLVTSILRIYRNFQDLLDYSERDTLTGLRNRRTFEETFCKLTDKAAVQLQADAEPAGPSPAERRNAPDILPYYLCVIDIDHFKRVNDSCGHLIGDEVLLLLSRLMRSVFRFHDQLYRFGGEEFVVLMRCGCDADAASALERLRAVVRAYRFPQVGHITVSAGFTRMRLYDTPSAAFDRADRAVYWAKDRGRDRVCNHAALVGDLQQPVDTAVGDIDFF